MLTTHAARRVQADILRFSRVRNPVDVDVVHAIVAHEKRSVEPMFNVAKYNQALRAGKTEAAAKKLAREGDAAPAKKREPNPTKKARKKKPKKRKSAKKSAAPKARKKKAKRKARKSAARAAPHVTREEPKKMATKKKSKKGGRRKGSGKKRKGGAKRKSRKKKSRKKTKTVRVQPQVKTQTVRVVIGQKRKKGKKRRKNPASTTALATIGAGSGFQPNPSPTIGGLFENPGPFTRTSMMKFGSAAFGVGFGLVLADVADRWIATRTPENGKHPWYGRSAAAAIARRPDGMRFLGQLGVMVLAMAGAYFTRNGRVLPWLLSGTAVGAGARIVKAGVDWYLMPAILKVDDFGKESLGNRLYPVEQGSVQDEVDKIFADFNATPALQANQADTPSISSPLAAPGTAVYTLGKARSGESSSPQGLAADPQGNLHETGRLGKCTSCGGYNGCYSACPEYTKCGPCMDAGGGTKTCIYEVQAGDDLVAMARAANADLAVVRRMNGDRESTVFWAPGQRVALPYAMCAYIAERDGMTAGNGATPIMPMDGSSITPPAVAITDVVSGIDDEHMQAAKAQAALMAVGGEADESD